MFAEDRVRGERGGGRVPKGGGGRAQRLLEFYEQQVRQVGSVSRRFELNHAACCGSHSSAPPPVPPTPTKGVPELSGLQVSLTLATLLRQDIFFIG